MGRKHCGKKRNCLLRAISPFPTVFFKRLVLQTRKKQGLFGKGLMYLPSHWLLSHHCKPVGGVRVMNPVKMDVIDSRREIRQSSYSLPEGF